MEGFAMSQSTLLNRRCPIALGGLACLLALPASAQIVIEEIVVTSQKREQSLQEVPIAVSAFDAETLRRSGLKDIRDLQQLSPSLVLTSTQSESAGTTARLRGVGTTGDNLGLESSVAVFVDGVYRNRNSVALTDLGNLERIEVLRGPQGTLFGKNASAGLIHVITKEPDVDEFSGYVSGSYGDYEEIRIGGGVTGPIVEGRAGFSLDASWTERDGIIDNVSTKPGVENEYNDRDRYLIRGQLSSQIGEALDLRLIADYASRDETCCAAVTIIDGPTAAIINGPNPFTGGVPLGTVITPADPFARNTTANPPPSGGYISEVDDYGVSLEINWDVGPGTLTSISSYRNWESERSMDLDYTDAEILYRVAGGYGNDFETLTQELRYTWEASNIDFMLGFYYVDEELDVLDGIRVGSAYEAYVNTTLFVLGEPLLPPGSFVDGRGALTDAFLQETDSYAFFTHNTWHATDRLNITVGLRYTDEEKDVTANLVADNPACLAVATGQLMLGPTGTALTCLPLISPLVDNALNPVLMGAPYKGDRGDSEWTGTLVVDYALTEDWLGYLSYSRGYKAGGFNLDRAGFSNPNPIAGTLPSTADLEFEPETVDSYEIGAKGALWDDRVQLNVAAFWSTFDDFQLNTFTGTNFVVTNLEEVESKGVEIEGQAYLTEGLRLTTGVSYTDAQYDEGISDPVLAGRRLTNAPYWIVTAAADYERPISANLLGFVHLDYRFTGDHNTGSDLDKEKVQPSYAVFNGSVGLAAQDERWELEVWAKNLFDRDYRQVAFDAPLQAGSFNAFLGDPRTWGIRGRFNF
jgi:outer membrane receptor protein involved in Fe transport